MYALPPPLPAEAQIKFCIAVINYTVLTISYYTEVE
jgi:hypothetical protein